MHLQVSDNSCFVLIHVDDILAMGRRDFVFKKFLTCLKANYEVPTQLMEKPGDEVHVLKGRMVLQHDFRFAIQTHHKHVQQMCSLLELQGKKTPGHCDMDQCDRPGPCAALNSPVEGFKISARRTLANMSDINDDEGSPNFIRAATLQPVLLIHSLHAISSRHCSMVPDPTQGLAQTWRWLQTPLDVEKHTHLQVQRNF